MGELNIEIWRGDASTVLDYLDAHDRPADIVIVCVDYDHVDEVETKFYADVEKLVGVRWEKHEDRVVFRPIDDAHAYHDVRYFVHIRATERIMGMAINGGLW